jgi:hypothetical protein
MNVTLLRATAIVCCGLLWSCGVYVPLENPDTLSPGETSVVGGVNFYRPFGFDVTPMRSDMAWQVASLPILTTGYISGHLGILPGYDVGAIAGFSLSDMSAGVVLKRRLSRDSLYSSALSLGANYVYSPLFVGDGGFLNLTWTAGTKNLIFQTQGRVLAGNRIPPRYGLNQAIALRVLSSGRRMYCIGINGGFLTGAYLESRYGDFAGTTLGWVALIVQMTY